MAQYVLGQVSIANRGNYAANTAYLPLNVVSHRGGQFMCTTACNNIEPGVSSNWQNYWVATAKGIYSTVVTAPTATTAKITITYSDGTTAENTYTTTGTADNSISNDKLMQNAVDTDNIVDGAVTPAKTDGIQAQHKTATAVLASGRSSWTVSVTGVTPTNSVVVSPANNAAYLLWRNNSIRVIAQGDGELTFMSDSNPTADVNVNVLIFD